MDPNTFPTKGNLILAKNSLALSKQGYELMDKKRNILIREMMELIDQAKDIQTQIDETFRTAYAALQKANMEIGIAFVDQISHTVPVENSIRIKIIIHQFKYSKKIFFLCNIIHTVTDADDSTYRSIKFKLPHILFQIKDLMTGFCPFFHGLSKHFLGIIYADHIITGLCQKFRHHSGPAAKFQHDPVFNSVFLKASDQIFRPFFIFHIVHENVINSGEITVCFHKNLQIFSGRSIARSVHIIPCLPV